MTKGKGNSSAMVGVSQDGSSCSLIDSKRDSISMHSNTSHLENVCDADVENKRMDTKGGKPWQGGDGGVLNWAIGIDMYTLMCIKLMTKGLPWWRSG